MGEPKKIGDAKMAERALNAFVNEKDGRIFVSGFCAREGLPMDACHNISWAIQEAYECEDWNVVQDNKCSKFEPRPFDEKTYKKLTGAGLSEDFAREFVAKGGIHALNDRIKWLSENILKRSVFDRKFTAWERHEMVIELKKYGKASLVALPELLTALKNGDVYMRQEVLETLQVLMPRSKEMVQLLIPLLSDKNDRISGLAGAILAKAGYVDESLIDGLIVAAGENYLNTGFKAAQKALFPYGEKAVERIFLNYREGKMSREVFMNLLDGFDESLGRFVSELHKMFKEGDPVPLIMRLIASAGPAAEPYVQEFLSIAESKGEDSDLYFGAVAALAIFGDSSPATLGLIADLFKRSDIDEVYKGVLIQRMKPIPEYAPLILDIIRSHQQNQFSIIVMRAEELFSAIGLSFSDISRFIGDLSYIYGRDAYAIREKLLKMSEKDMAGVLDYIKERLLVSRDNKEIEFLLGSLNLILGDRHKKEGVLVLPVITEIVMSSGDVDIRVAAINAIGRMGRYSWLMIPILEGIRDDVNEPFLQKAADLALKKITDDIF